MNKPEKVKISRSAPEAVIDELKRRMFDSMLDGVLILDAKGYIVKINPAWCASLGYASDELVGLHIFQLNPPEYSPKVSERMQQVATRGYAIFETALARKDGAVMPVEISAKMVEINGKKFYLCTVRDISERKQAELASQHSANLLRKSTDMLDAISQALSLFIGGSEHRTAFETMLEILLKYSASEYGFIGEVMHDQDGQPYLKLRVQTNISWDEESRALYEEYAAQGLEFHNLNTLFGHVLTTGAYVISNDPKSDPRSGGLPHGHPAMNSFLGLPLYKGNEFIGMLGVANRAGGYDEAFCMELEPLTVACASLIQSYRDYSMRIQAEEALRQSESNYRELMDQAADAIFVSDRNGLRYLDVNRAACELLGYTREELLKLGIADIFDPDELKQAPVKFPDMKSGQVISMECRHRRKDGSHILVELNACMLSDGRLQAIVRDITERKKADEALQLASMAYENSSEAMMVCDAENRIVAVNPAFEKITGYTADEVRGKKPSIFKSDKHPPSFFQAMWHELNTTGQWHGEVCDKRKDGSQLVKLLTINTIQDSEFRYVALFTDITERKRTEELVWEQANYDGLTKLPNRRMFHDRLEHESIKSHRARLPLALMLIDLDRFKEVNDTLGHDMGDMLLIEAARRISECVRETDTVARLGGDEFTVILSELDDPLSVERIAQNIIRKLTEPFALGDERAFVSASIGISLYPNDTTDMEVLFKNVDQAMYVAKNAGRNRFSYFTPSMQEQAQKRLRITNDLRSALAANEFRVYYQPIVELASGQIYKAEALLRWMHPMRGIVDLTDFIPIAEETGLIIPIGDWVFRKAVQQVKLWRSKYHDSFQISVNKSPVQMSEKESDNSWHEYLQLHDVPGRSITIEITEGLLLNAESKINKKLLSFRDAGIQVAIDDFGTGYSSLSYLKKFDIDYLKIDKSFVRNLGEDKNDLALCEAIIVMAHKLDLKVVAEGVETVLQRDLLFNAGCDYAQGFLFSKPVTAEEFEKLLVAKQ